MSEYPGMNKLLLFLLAMIATGSSQAQKTPKEKKDPYTSTELWTPVPINRALAHDKIDTLQKRIDEFDGKFDHNIDLIHDPQGSEIVTKAILNEVDRLEIVIENMPDEHSTKQKYLAYLAEDLRSYYADMLNNEVDPLYFKNLIDNFELIYRRQHEEQPIMDDVRNHFNRGFYGHMYILKDQKDLIDTIYDHMVMLYPEEMWKKFSEIVSRPAAIRMMNYMAYKNPTLILTYSTSTAIQNGIVRKSQDPLVKTIVAIADQCRRPFRGITFLDDLMDKSMTIETVNEITQDTTKYYRQLILSRLKPNPLTKKLVDRESKLMALEYVRVMNELHDEKDSIRFRIIESLPPSEMYYLMVLCSDEIYTSTFVGTFNRMLLKMQPMKGDQFLKNIQMDKFRTFIRMCAGYNKLDEFLATMDEGSKNELMSTFVHFIDKNTETDVEDAVDIADACGSIRDENLLVFLMNELKKDYERTYTENNKRGLIIYFLLNTLATSILYPDLGNATLQEHLKIPPITFVPYSKLQDRDTVFEQVFFYGDEDGKSSLSNYLSNYKPSDWKIEKNEKWMTITSLNGRPVKIFANLPLDEPEDELAQQALCAYLNDNHIHPSVIIHRGHSYHLSGTLKYLKEFNKVIILGSCGGYHNLSTILGYSEDAHIVSSKQTGTMLVTDPIIKAFNSRLHDAKDINWIDLWDEVEKQMNTPALEDKFNDYVPPHKNMGALFLKAFKIQMKEIGEEI